MINNLKTNEKILVKQKIKLQKRNIVPTTLMICATMLLTGCSKQHYYDYSSIESMDYEVENETSIQIEDYNFNNKNEIKNYLKFDETSEKEKFKITNTESIEKIINSHNTEYKYEYLYNPNEIFDRYESEISFSNDHKSTLKYVSLDDLYEKVLENNTEYLNNKSVCFYDQLSDEEIKKICQYIIDIYNSYSSNTSINFDETKCILNNLKIFGGNTIVNAYVTDDYCLVISPNMLDVLALMNNGEDVDVFKNTIIHETTHLFQMSCPDRINETTKMIGISPQYDDVNINSLNFSWYYEASAEKCTTNYTNNNPLVYQYMINYLESLSLVTILDDNVKVSQNEHNCFTKDLNSIFEMFNCNTREEKIEIINLMYSIEIIEVEPDEFFEALDGVSKNEVKQEIKNSICITLTKYFYKNLTEKIKNKEVTLEDLFFMINLFESNINSHINYNISGSYETYKEFFDYYEEVQNTFFETISVSNDITTEELVEKLNNYNIKNENDNYYNASLKWLDEEKKQYLAERQHYLVDYSNTNIHDIIDKNAKKVR